jgi:hypothetical protein
MAIFVSLTSFFIINFNTVNSRIALDNQAHEIALWIREAQAYAMGIRASGSTFTPTYGIYFDTSTPGSFIVFVDRSSPRNFVYDAGGTCGDGSSECLKQISLPARMTISAISAKDSGGATVSPSPTAINISFTRPNADATIRDATTGYSEAEITISSPRGYNRKIGVISSGQIAVR